MNVRFENPKHEELVGDYARLTNWCGKRGRPSADDVLLTLDQIRAAETIEDVPNALRPHPLKGKLKGHFGVWITEKFRVVIRPDPQQDPPAQLGQRNTIKSVLVVELCTDYHSH